MARHRRIAVLLGLVLIVLFGLSGAAFAAPKVIHVWHTETNPASIEAVTNIVKRFEAAHPDIKVEAEALAWGDLEGKIMAALASGSPPELSHGQPITCAALQAKGILMPLDDVVAAIGEDNIWDQIKQVGKFGDHYYGLVHAAGTSLLIYRKDMAAAKGLEGPKTWDDFLKIAKEMTQDTDGDGKIDIYGVTIPGDNLFINILIGELTKANGGILFDETNRPPFHRSDHDRDVEFPQGNDQVPAAGLGRARVSGNLCQPVRAEGGHDVPGLRPRRFGNRTVRARGLGEHRPFRRLDQAPRPQRRQARPPRWTRSPG